MQLCLGKGHLVNALESLGRLITVQVTYDSFCSSIGQHHHFKPTIPTEQLSKLLCCRPSNMARVSEPPFVLSLGTENNTCTFRIGDIINLFRTTKLGLSPLNIRSGPGYVDRLKIPWTYCISPALVPKPADWKNHIGTSINLRSTPSRNICFPRCRWLLFS